MATNSKAVATKSSGSPFMKFLVGLIVFAIASVAGWLLFSTLMQVLGAIVLVVWTCASIYRIKKLQYFTPKQKELTWREYIKAELAYKPVDGADAVEVDKHLVIQWATKVTGRASMDAIVAMVLLGFATNANYQQGFVVYLGIAAILFAIYDLARRYIFRGHFAMHLDEKVHEDAFTARLGMSLARWVMLAYVGCLIGIKFGIKF